MPLVEASGCTVFGEDVEAHVVAGRLARCIEELGANALLLKVGSDEQLLQHAIFQCRITDDLIDLDSDPHRGGLKQDVGGRV